MQAQQATLFPFSLACKTPSQTRIPGIPRMAWKHGGVCDRACSGSEQPTVRRVRSAGTSKLAALAPPSTPRTTASPGHDYTCQTAAPCRSRCSRGSSQLRAMPTCTCDPFRTLLPSWQLPFFLISRFFVPGHWCETPCGVQRPPSWAATSHHVVPCALRVSCLVAA